MRFLLPRNNEHTTANSDIKISEKQRTKQIDEQQEIIRHIEHGATEGFFNFEIDTAI